MSWDISWVSIFLMWWEISLNFGQTILAWSTDERKGRPVIITIHANMIWFGISNLDLIWLISFEYSLIRFHSDSTHTRHITRSYFIEINSCTSIIVHLSFKLILIWIILVSIPKGVIRLMISIFIHVFV